MPPELTADFTALRQQYERDGYFTRGGIWSDADIEELNRAADELTAVKPGVYAPEMHPHRRHPAFLQALCNPNVVAIMEQLLGGKVSGLQTQYYFCRAGTQGFAMHQDNSYVQAPPDAFASVWTALEDVTVENGCLVMYPGTHCESMLPLEPCPYHAEQAGQDVNANRLQVVLPPQYQGKGLDCPLKRGEAAFFHCHTVHSSNPNKSNHFRRSLLMTYLRRGAPFRAGNNSRREEVDVYTAAEGLR